MHGKPRESSKYWIYEIGSTHLSPLRCFSSIRIMMFSTHLSPLRGFWKERSRDSEIWNQEI
ncbi:hypothetical protein JT359_19230, partial [Candidatus Poribacteria bacterium]|nr:hypothetical protein [Candidatus Poribacteria bacterium]